MPVAIAESEALIRAAVPQARQCLVVSATIGPRVATDVILTLAPDADPDADYEPAIRAALPEDTAATLRRIMTFPDKDHSPLSREHHLLELVGARLPGIGPAPDPRPTPTDRIPVDFVGDGEGAAELSWGQREIWQSMTRQGNWLPLGGRKALDPGTTVADVAGELAYLHSRFATMRTRLHFDDAWRPHQSLAATGTTHLEVFDAPDDSPESADALATSIEELYQHRPYDLRTEWPIRMGVVRQGGAATRMVVLMHHVAVDGGGAEVMIRDAATRSTEPQTSLPPLDQAQWQASPAGQRQNQRALRYFERLLRTVPVPRFPAPTDPRRPRWWGVEYESPALRHALPLISAETGADPTDVMLAVYAIALARVTGVNPVVLRPVVGNRFRPMLADAVCNAANAGLLAVDVEGAPFKEVVERARRAAMNAFKNGYHDPEQFDALVVRIGQERGADLDVKSFFNDRRADRSMAAQSPTPESLQAAVGTGRLSWTSRRNVPVERLFVQINDVADAIKLSIEADTHALAPAQLEELARGVEEAAVRAALEASISRSPGA